MRRRILENTVWTAILVTRLCSVESAIADSPVYADINGLCGGKSPCYSTIEDAVRAASDPDAAGPLFAEVFVFPGTYVETVTLSGMGGGVHGDLRLTTVDGTGAPSPGTAAIKPMSGNAIRSGQLPFEWRIMIDGFMVTSADSSAIEAFGVDDITIVNVVAAYAGYAAPPSPGSPVGIGIRVTSTLGDVTIRDSTVRNCNTYGILAIAEAANLVIDAVVATDNKREGIIANATRDLIVRDSSASGNGIGLSLSAYGNVTVMGCLLDQNTDGILAFAGDALTVVSTTAIDNLGDGIYVQCEAGSIVLDRLTAARNNRNIRALSARDIVVTNSSSTDSALDAFLLGAEENITLDSLFARRSYNGIALNASGDVQIINAAAEECSNHGFVVVCDGSVTMDRITAVDQANGAGVIVHAWSQFVQGLAIRNSLIADNANAPGIYLEQLAPGGSHVVAGSIICNNSGGQYGLFQDGGAATIDARGNWWGDVTGPKRPNSSAGLGDGIFPGGGEILVDPWIDQITAVASHETATLANDVTVQFQFRHGGSETYLGEGPGAIGARRPFIVTTNNGKVSSHDQTAAEVSAFISGVEGIVEVIAKGADEGPAKIELSGLCFPARSVTIEVIPVPVPLPPNPTPIVGANPSPATGADPAAEPKRSSPFCGAGVSMMAGMSVVSLLATRLSTRSRRSRPR